MSDELTPAQERRLVAAAERLGRATNALIRREKIDAEITEMGAEMGRPRLAKKLIREGVSATEAFKRFLAADATSKAKKARAEAINAARIAAALGGEGARSGVPHEPIKAKPTPKGKDNGWTAAIAAAKPDAKIGSGWDEIIEAMKNGR